MRRYPLIVVALSALLVVCASGVVSASLGDPNWWITGNDTGGIIVYSPAMEGGVYHELAAAHCARWHRLSHVTGVHPKYGDYISFVCIDRPGMIH